MAVASTKKSLKVRTNRGTLLRPSGRDVVQSSTMIDRRFFGGSEDNPTMKAVVAILAMLLRETLSEDVVKIVFLGARKMAMDEGVSAEEFDRVKAGLMEFWRDRFTQHPLAGMFRR